MILDEIEVILSQFYQTLQNAIPEQYRLILALFFFSLLVVAYAIFVWKFYRFVARKDIIRINLKQYNRSEHPLWNKIIAVVFYFFEYIIILPFVIFFWFSIFALFLFFLGKNMEADQILLIAGVIVAAIRLTAYYHGSLSKELSKLFPFTLLVVFLTTGGFFSIPDLLAKISQIPNFVNHAIYYLLFIIFLEVLLRIFDLAFSFAGSEEEREEMEEEG